MRLDQAPVGADLEIRAVHAEPEAALRLREIGLGIGDRLRVVQCAAFGARVVAIAGTRIALDRVTAHAMRVARVPGTPG